MTKNMNHTWKVLQCLFSSTLLETVTLSLFSSVSPRPSPSLSLLFAWHSVSSCLTNLSGDHSLLANPGETAITVNKLPDAVHDLAGRPHIIICPSACLCCRSW